jgi:hypothetical protein
MIANIRQFDLIPYVLNIKAIVKLYQKGFSQMQE